MKSGKPLFFTVFLLTQFIPSSFLAGQQKSSTSAAAKPAAETKLVLREGWELQTSAKVEAKGEAISTAAFSPKGWHAATVPTTVVAALVTDKTLPDPFPGMNLRSFPGVNYPIGANFSNIAMASDSPYAVSWWYRKAFTIPSISRGLRSQVPRMCLRFRRSRQPIMIWPSHLWTGILLLRIKTWGCGGKFT